jgi:cytoskeleton protein RodZ
MSQQQAAEALNLDPAILAYLETNDFAALGAPVFVKGHLRRYATLLGMNEDELLLAYERSKQHLGEPTLVPKSRLEMAPVRGKPRWPWVVGGAVLFLVASALIAYVSENGLPWAGGASDEPASDVASDASQATPTDVTTGTVPPAANARDATTVPANGPAPFSSASPGPASAAAPAADAAAAPPSGQLNLQLRFTADSWVEVFDGSGKAVLYDLGKAGSERTITAQPPVSVTLGDARGVGIIVNGRTLPPPPRAAGETLARFSIGADGNLR